MCTSVQKFGGLTSFWNKLILLFSKDTLNWQKVRVNIYNVTKDFNKMRFFLNFLFIIPEKSITKISK